MSRQLQNAIITKCTSCIWLKEVMNWYNLKSLTAILTRSDIEFYLLFLLLAMLKPVYCLWILSIYSKLVCPSLGDHIVITGSFVFFFTSRSAWYSNMLVDLDQLILSIETSHLILWWATFLYDVSIAQWGNWYLCHSSMRSSMMVQCQLTRRLFRFCVNIKWLYLLTDSPTLNF